MTTRDEHRLLIAIFQRDDYLSHMCCNNVQDCDGDGNGDRDDDDDDDNNNYTTISLQLYYKTCTYGSL